MNARPMLPAALPAALQGFTAHKQWLNYRIIPQEGGKAKKVAIGANGWQVDPTDPAHWMTYEQAATLSDKLAFCFSADDPYFFLDIDNALQPNGQWSPLAIDLCTRLAGCAVEVSSSEKGLHIFGRGSPGKHSCRRDELGIEFYTEGRFAALTGTNALGDCDYEPQALAAVVAEFFPPRAHQAATDWTDGPCDGWAGPTDDAELVRRASRHVSAASAFAGRATFADLWAGNAEALAESYPSSTGPYDASSADAALCAHLAWWTGKDCERMARLLRESGLRRDKHDREDYVQRTVLRACGLVTDVLCDRPPAAPSLSPAEMLEVAKANPPRYKLLGASELRNLPPLAWRVRGVLPATGLAALYGPSGSGKSFLAFDMAATIAEGGRWFDCRVEAAPVVYAALEGEAGFKQRAQAWEASRKRPLPDGLKMMLQPFKLTDMTDVIDLAAVVPAGAVVVIDTLNRASPTADENSSRDMGEILEGAKTLQAACDGLVLMVHHTGKDQSRGLRGHSSLFAAMDAAIEVSRTGGRRKWTVAKSKDGMDGEAHPFRLQVEPLGIEETGEPITSCVVEIDTAPASEPDIKPIQGSNQRVIYEALGKMLKEASPCSDAPDTCPPGRAMLKERDVLRHLSECLPDTVKRPLDRTKEAITSLEKSGHVRREDGWIWIA